MRTPKGAGYGYLDFDKTLISVYAACFLLVPSLFFLTDRSMLFLRRKILLPDFARQIDAAQALEIVHGRGMSGSVTLSFKRTPEGWGNARTRRLPCAVRNL